MSIIRPFAKRFSLAAKFSLGAIVLTLVTSLGICFFIVRIEAKEHYEDLIKRGVAHAAITASRCAPATHPANKARLHNILEHLSQDDEIAYVSVIDRQSSVLVSQVFINGLRELQAYSVPNDNTSIIKPFHRDVVDEKGHRYVEIIHPILREADKSTFHVQKTVANGSEVIGYLQLGLTQEAVLNSIRQKILSITLFTACLLLVGTGVAILLSRRLVSPLKRLTKASQDIAEGKFDAPLEAGTHDELADLTASFNHMQERFRAYRELVEKQTSEMAASNSNLVQEINARKMAEQQILHDAFHDAVTGLPNRALLTDRLSHAIMLSKRRKDYNYGVLFMDIDRFKVINDSVGHTVGDELLRAFGQRVRALLRPHDTIARFGGDAFAVLLEDIRTPSNATYITERICSDFATPLTLSSRELFVTASIGIAFGSGGDEHPDQVLRDAEVAMYRAKQNTGTKYVVFETGMHAHAVERMKLETDLRTALERKEFLVYYQPIVSSQTGQIVGFEALVRWQHPERGMVSPADFIPIAEETGFIVSIDRMVLKTACAQMREWQLSMPDNPIQFISVNVSNEHMAQPDMVSQVERILETTGLKPEYLKLEITENVIIKNSESILDRLHRLRTLGVQLYIDDFGTGYSSLSYLHRLPINGFKIDRSFIKRLGKNGENQEIVKTITLLAKDMRVEVVAEGVETGNQLAQISSLQCDFWQGYLSSKPVPDEEARKLIVKDLEKNTQQQQTV